MIIKSAPKRRRNEESITQQHFLNWLALQYPRVHDVTASFPNSGKRNLSYAMKMKREGMKKGMPDIVLFFPSREYHGMLIEFKSKTGRLRPEQKYIIEKLIEQRYHCVVCSSLEESINKVKEYLA